jgi:hypothetical protein
MTFKPTFKHVKENKTLLVMLTDFPAGTKEFPKSLICEDVLYTKYDSTPADYDSEPDLEYYECYVSEIVNPPIDESDIQDSEIFY